MKKDTSKEVKAVVLTSGGLDSSTCIGMAIEEGREIFPLSIEYGQKHLREVKSISDVVVHYRTKTRNIEPYGFRSQVNPLKKVKIDLRAIGGSALTDDSIAVPEGRDESEMSESIPLTYVPARNTIMLSIALGYAEVIEADEIWIGANDVDYSGYPDCRPEFLEAYETLAQLATVRGIQGNPLKIRAPLLSLTKAEIIKKGNSIGVPYHLTWSCYNGANKACSVCDSCTLRLKGFKEAGSEDPIDYQ